MKKNTRNAKRVPYKPNRKRVMDVRVVKEDVDVIRMSHNTITPPKKRITLHYINTGVVQDAAANFKVVSWRINDLFDPIPLLGGTGFAGYFDIVDLYANWIVDSVDIRVLASNNDSVAYPFGVFCANTDMAATITSRQECIDSVENSFSSRIQLLGQATGMSRETFRFRVAPHAVYGNKKIYYGSGDFSGSAGASPSKFVYVNLAVWHPTTGNVTNGLILDLELDAHATFYNHLYLYDTFSKLTQDEKEMIRIRRKQLSRVSSNKK